MPGTVNKFSIDMFKVFSRRVVNDGAGSARQGRHTARIAAIVTAVLVAWLFIILACQLLDRHGRGRIDPRGLSQSYARLVSICEFDASLFEGGANSGNVVDQPYSLTEFCFHPY
jgi:hypothetical protein